MFRFAAISPALARVHGGEPLAEAVRAVARMDHVGLDGAARRVSQRSIRRWLAAYRAAGMSGLEPRRESRATPSQVLPPRLVDFLVQEKLRDRAASIPEVLRRATERGILQGDHGLDRSTVYRAARRLELPLARRKGARERDSRRFAFPHRMDMVLCDGKHFRAGARRKRRVALFFIDDASRFILHVVVGTSETAELFQRGLYECLARYGHMSVLYLDRGPGFIAQDTVDVFANLEIPFVHGEAGYKEGRGKIERFNRTVKADLLRALDGRPDVDPACGALELRLQHYTGQVYAHRPHESLRGRTPAERFTTDPRALRMPESRERLRAKFELAVERRVSTDHVVSIGAADYEMPRGYAGTRVVLYRRLLDGTIGFTHQGQVIELKPVDPAANARARRGKDQNRDEPLPMPPATAAELAFNRDFD
ncbi:MAG: DDE-type integrase/transposase/recombinase, partial [Phycisphaerae bacterium]